MYFKIQGTYFKICALYFWRFQVFDKQQLTKLWEKWVIAWFLAFCKKRRDLEFLRYAVWFLQDAV